MRSGATALHQDWAGELPVRIAAPAAVEPADVLPRPVARRLDRAAQFALIAAREAWTDAGFTRKAGETGLSSGGGDRAGGDAAPADPYRVGAVVGTGVGGVTTLLGQYDVLRERGTRKVSPLRVPMLRGSRCVNKSRVSPPSFFH